MQSPLPAGYWQSERSHWCRTTAERFWSSLWTTRRVSVETRAGRQRRCLEDTEGARVKWGEDAFMFHGKWHFLSNSNNQPLSIKKERKNVKKSSFISSYSLCDPVTPLLLPWPCFVLWPFFHAWLPPRPAARLWPLGKHESDRHENAVTALGEAEWLAVPFMRTGSHLTHQASSGSNRLHTQIVKIRPPPPFRKTKSLTVDNAINSFQGRLSFLETHHPCQWWCDMTDSGGPFVSGRKSFRPHSWYTEIPTMGSRWVVFSMVLSSRGKALSEARL